MKSSDPPTVGHTHAVSVIPEVLSAEVYSYQSNVKRPQSGMGKEKKLYSDEQLAN